VNPDGGTIAFHERTGTFAIYATREVHDQIENLFAALRKVRDPHATQSAARAQATRRPEALASLPPPTRHYAAPQSWNVPQLHH
jgi:hypothetical protein